MLKNIALTIIIFSLAACSARTDLTTLPSGGSVEDLTTFAQNLNFYADNIKINQLLNTQEQDKYWQRTQELFFRPWEQKKSLAKKQDVFYGVKLKGYAENLLPWTEKDLAELLDNADENNFPSLFQRAIVTRPTALRLAPTHKPKFDNPDKAGQGYPFDMIQTSTLPLAMPVLIVHKTHDRAWAYVENALVSGWVKINDLATIDDKDIKYYKKFGLMAVVKENLSLNIINNDSHIAVINIGTLLPGYTTVKHNDVRVLVPIREISGKARFIKIKLSKNAVKPAPLDFTATGLAVIGNEFMGQKYGWGALNENRDCSSMLRDLFLPFGIWLPRNSAAQAKAWQFKSFAGLSITEKEAAIINEAKPFKTLVCFQGHIGLYLGTYKDKPLIFHNMWGVRTNANNKEGRYVIGRAIVSSLQLGAELEHVENKNRLLDITIGISTIIEE